MKVLIKKLKTVSQRIEARNKQIEKLIRETEIFLASKSKKIVINGNGKIKIL